MSKLIDSKHTGVIGKNLLIDGSFKRWSKGEDITLGGSSIQYVSDMWQGYHNTAQFTKNTGTINGIEQDYLTMNTHSSTQIWLGSMIEGGSKYSGKSLTMSFWAKCNNPIHLDVAYKYRDLDLNNSIETNVMLDKVLTTSWQKLECTVNFVDTNQSIDRMLQFIINRVCPADTILDITNVKLELGTVATPFVADTEAELDWKIGRYYEIMNLMDRNSGIRAFCSTTNYCYGALVWKQKKASVPTITLPNAGTGIGEISFLKPDNTYPTTIGNHASDNITVDGCEIIGGLYSNEFIQGNITILYSNEASIIEIDSRL